MFGSISNWINNNLPQAIPPVNMPTMPNMPNIPDIFHTKSTAEAQSNGSSSTDAANKQAADNLSTIEPATSQQNAETKTLNDNVVGNNINSEGAGEAAGEQHMFSGMNMNIDIDPQKALGNAANTAKEIGSNIGNMLFSFGKNASTNVFKTANHLKDVIEKKTIIGDFSKENEKFINEKKTQQRREEAALAPWVGYNEEEILKEQIMELSTDSRNFLRSPPDGVDFQFDFNLAYPVALATLEEDSNLKDMRFKLVPVKISEETFWRNYFYRVSLIKQSCQLESLNNQNKIYADSPTDSLQNLSEEASKPNKNQYQQNDASNLAGNEFVSDSYDETVNVDEIKSDLRQLKLDNNKKQDDLEEWDKELPEDIDSISAEELEKEINQMIGKQ